MDYLWNTLAFKKILYLGCGKIKNEGEFCIICCEIRILKISYAIQTVS